MIKGFATFVLASASASVLYGQVPIPDLYIYNYTLGSRDPFISVDAPTTLLTENRETVGIVSGDIVRQYLAKIVQLIRDELYVGGVSIGDTPVQSIALINGIDFHTG